MNELDREIRAALSAEEKQLFDELGADMSMNEMMIAPFQTRMRWWSALVFFMTFAWAVAAFWCGYYFFTAEQAADIAFWGILALGAMIAVAMLKLWFFMEMNKVSIVRELRRVELQLAAAARNR